LTHCLGGAFDRASMSDGRWPIYAQTVSFRRRWRRHGSSSSSSHGCVVSLMNCRERSLVPSTPTRSQVALLLDRDYDCAAIRRIITASRSAQDIVHGTNKKRRILLLREIFVQIFKSTLCINIFPRNI